MHDPHIHCANIFGESQRLDFLCRTERAENIEQIAAEDIADRDICMVT